MTGLPTVAFLGLGTMGAAMAGRAMQGGLPTVVWDRNPDRAAPLGDLGAVVALSVPDAAGSADVVVTMVSDGDAVMAIATDQGLLAAFRPGSTWAQMSTIGIRGTERLAAMSGERRPDVHFVDAPVSGSRVPAEQGGLLIFASGPDVARERVASVFDVLGRRTLWLGAAGAGSRTLVPARADPDGLLPPLLLGLTFVTGLVDAYSYLRLGHVFVANMTGNVVFFAFALAGAKGFSILASVLALAAFATGALLGGRIGSRHSSRRQRMLAVGTTLECALVTAALIVSAVSHPWPEWVHYVIIVLLAVGLGVQNAGARRLGVRDLTTTVLTLTIVGIAADSRLARGRGSHGGRRLLAVFTMGLGALVGSLLTLRVGTELPFGVGVAVLLVVIVGAAVAGRRETSD